MRSPGGSAPKPVPARLVLMVAGCRLELFLRELAEVARTAAGHYRTFRCAAGRPGVRIGFELDAYAGDSAGKTGPPSIRNLGPGWRIRRSDFDVRLEAGGRDDAWTVRGRLSDHLMSLDSLLRIVLSLVLPRHDGLLIHAAGIRFGQSGVAFPGRSGLGKTTLCRRAPRVAVLNDELVALTRTRERRRNESPATRWILHPTPFWGEMAQDGGASWRGRKQRPVPLAGVAHLARGRRGAPPGVPGILRSVLFFGTDPGLAAHVLRLAVQLERETPNLRWRWTLDEPWPMLARRLFESLAATRP